MDLGVRRALFDFGVRGTWALRDAADVLESLFLLIGFVVAGTSTPCFDWLRQLLLAGVRSAIAGSA